LINNGCRRFFFVYGQCIIWLFAGANVECSQKINQETQIVNFKNKVALHKKNHSNRSDVIIIGAGSGGLSVGLFLAKVGIQVTMIVKSDKDVGGECLNDGCVPSKALIHVARQMRAAGEAQSFGIKLSGEVDIQKAIGYVHDRQEIIRKHENAAWLSEQGINVVLGEASFAGKNEVAVNGEIFSAKKNYFGDRF